MLSSGCAAVTNPVAEGVPVRRLPREFLPPPRQALEQIPLTWLRQPPPDVYRLDVGDVLGVYIESVLGEKNVPPPVRLAEAGNAQPALGYPIPVLPDGTVRLPMVDAVQVKGLSLVEVQERILKAYTVDKKFLQPDKAVLVSLVAPRTYQVLVVREDASALTVAPTGAVGSARRGTGATISMPAYENDVLNALTRTGGLPGVDAMNEVVIQRGSLRAKAEAKPNGKLDAQPGEMDRDLSDQVVRIPLRTLPGTPRLFSPEDVILRTGDIVFIEARDTEFFYTGGLLSPRQYVLPRDYDLSVVDAVALAGGPLLNGGVTQNNLSGAIIASGLGSPSPSHVSILRKTKGYGQVTIRVDLNLALRDPRENIRIQAGDVLILQETMGEALTRYVTTVLRFNFLGNLIRQRDLNATATGNLP
ncbi:MAG: polysaccharide biosynthesis/export family protein [Gemmataceae bacterium]|nr:polysaccharide biosynthesis/export family protein [Gemmataceae bacterium]